MFLPVEVIEPILAIYREEITHCEPVGEFINDQVALFTFVHCADTEQEAIDNGAAAATTWYVNTVLDFFELRERMLLAADELAQAARATPGSPLAEFVRMSEEAAASAPRHLRLSYSTRSTRATTSRTRRPTRSSVARTR